MNDNRQKPSLWRRVNNWLSFRTVVGLERGSDAAGRLSDRLERGLQRLFELTLLPLTWAGSLLMRLMPEPVRNVIRRIDESAPVEALTEKITARTDRLEYYINNASGAIGRSVGFFLSLFVPLLNTIDRGWFHGWWKFKAILAGIAWPFVWLGRLLLPTWVRTRLAAFAIRTRLQWLIFRQFTIAWWWTRDFGRLLYSIPALILSIPLITGLVLAPLYSKPDKIKHYQISMVDAAKSNDDAMHALCEEKLSQLGFERLPRTQFFAALELSQQALQATDPQDQVRLYERAYELMLAIAPVDKPGFENAHLWIASAFAEGRISHAAPWKLAEIHARHALTLNSESLVARRIMIEVDWEGGRREQAISEMEKLANDFPMLNARLMHYYRDRGKVEEARAKAISLVAHFQQWDENYLKQQKEKESGDEARFADRQPVYPLTPQDFLSWAAAVTVLGDPDQAMSLLQMGVERYPASTPLVATLMGVLISRYDDAASRSDNPAPLWLLDQALALAPDNPDLQTRLAMRLIQNETQARPLLEKLEQHPTVVSNVLLIAGDLLSSQGVFAGAAKFYHQATAAHHDNARAWNNVAWILGNVEPIDLGKAVQAANNAVASDPDPRYLETRGQIWLKLERWEEAIQDLERALNGAIPNSIDAHRGLAVAHERLGHDEQARAHRDMTGE